MKRKNGFTLIELLAVIVVLGVILTLAVPNIIKVGKNIRSNMYDKKMSLLEKTAQTYISDHRGEMSSEGTITVQTLLDANMVDPDESNMVINPANDKSMNSCTIDYTWTITASDNIKIRTDFNESTCNYN